MKQSNRNFIIAYILLVGVPIVALLLVLRVGRSITAPLSVDGNWKLQADAATGKQSECLKAIASAEDNILSISQSGQGLIFALNTGGKSTSAGTIDGSAIRGTIIPPAANGSCSADSWLTLAANVDPGASPRSLSGTLSTENCPGCEALTFHAVRQAGGSNQGPHR